MTVVLVDQLDWPAFVESDLPNVVWLRQHGAVGLLSPGLARFPNPEANSWATFTAGDVINTKNDHIGLIDRQLFANGEEENVVLHHLGDVANDGTLEQADRLIGDWRARSIPGNTLIFCAITPPTLADGSWDELTPVVIATVGGEPGNSLTSTTTRTKGLIALRDLAPTILSLVGAPIPISMTGAPAVPISLRNRDSTLERMATIARLGQTVIVPFSWFLGLSALFAVGGGAWFAASSRPDRHGIVRFLLRLVLASPLALLLAPCLPVTTTAAYLIALIGFDLAIASISSVAVIMASTSLLILIDGVSGSSLISATVVSGYWLSGIRFYGIGNEYMGVLIASSLLTPVLVLAISAKPTAAGKVSGGSGASVGFLAVTAAYYLAVVFILSYPGFGAKAGGAVASCAALGPAWYAMATGKRPTSATLAVGCACGFLLVFVLSAVAQRFHAPPSHIQSAVAAVHQGRLGYIKHVAIRKAKMAVKTVLTPGGIVAVCAIAPLWLFWRRSRLRGSVMLYLETRPSLAGALGAGFWSLIAVLLFNDSGGVALLFLFGAMSLVILHELVRSQCVYSR